MNSKKAPLRLLDQHGCSENVIRHCTAVSEQAVKIVKGCSIKIDRELVYHGALLHDIGRGRSHGIDHGIIGAEIARKEGLAEALQKIIERHIGAGITRLEAAALSLPVKDYMPLTPEEIIVSYADNLTSGVRSITFDQAFTLFKKRLRGSHPAVGRLKKQREIIAGWTKES